jgi:ADP-ribosylglycohydrolase
MRKTRRFSMEGEVGARCQIAHFNILRALALGDDADTTGAICGQLAGAYWGESQIPVSLRSGVARMDMLEKALAGIVGAAEATTGHDRPGPG